MPLRGPHFCISPCPSRLCCPACWCVPFSPSIPLHHRSGHTRSLGIRERCPILGRTRCWPPCSRPAPAVGKNITYSRLKTNETDTVHHIYRVICQYLNLMISTLRGSGLMAILAAVVTGSGTGFYMALLLIYVPLVYSPGREISTGCKSDIFFFS